MAYVSAKIIDYKKKTTTITQTFAAKSNKKTSQFEEWLNNVPMVLDQTRKLYNEQYDKCVKEQIPKDQALKILEPLDKRIKLLEKLAPDSVFHPIVRMGAGLADKGMNALDKMLDDVI